ncbi:MAG: ATPase, T2SS/T4P/T4SS family [Verrucomicrobiota bacterium]|nr:ATPase, T2SS/T4P/T4SS family [Verrucomicrobiota bacterium]
MAGKSYGERIAEVLINDGLLSQEQLDEVRDQQKQSGGQLLKLLAEKKFVTEEDLMISTGRCLDSPPVNVSKLTVSEEVRGLVSPDMARMHKLIPVARLGKKLFVAMADPLNVLALDDLKRATKMDVFPMIATTKAVMDALSGLKSTSNSSVSMEQLEEQEQMTLDGDGNVEIVDNKQDMDIEASLSNGQDAPVIKMTNLILYQAIKEGASDVHLEPYEKKVTLRYRIDGNCQEFKGPPRNMHNAIVSRIKIISGLDIAERRLPQDGRSRLKSGGTNFDLRVSILPMLHGEKVCIRINKGSIAANIAGLGMDESSFKRFMKAVDAPHGMLLVTGPTGSGKTTTLYAVLTELNKPQYNVVTVEDPVEVQINGVNQVPVRAEIGLTFAACLRSILRQDPDIVMIGEIRDGETADIAVKAALTGHQVLSTLHTNDAAGAIARMDDMGVAPFLISSSVILACAQRLAKRICPNCKEETEMPPADFLEKLDLTPEDVEGVTFYAGRGCDKCKGKGLAGRVPVIEVLSVSDRVRKMVIKRANSAELKKIAIEEGMMTLRMVAVEKAKEGIISLQEVIDISSDDH